MVIEANVKRMDTEKDLDQAQAQVFMWIWNLYGARFDVFHTHML